MMDQGQLYKENRKMRASDKFSSRQETSFVLVLRAWLCLDVVTGPVGRGG